MKLSTTGSVQAIQLAVSGLKAEYDNANGVEGRMVTGKTAQKTGMSFVVKRNLSVL